MKDKVREKHKTPKRKFKSDRQCTWTLPDGKRCNKRACGYFFCKYHLIAATAVEDGLMNVEMARLM